MIMNMVFYFMCFHISPIFIIDGGFFISAVVAQPVEHLIRNETVVGSNPIDSSIRDILFEVSVPILIRNNGCDPSIIYV